MGKRDLYLECNSGISGDMFVAAMLDLGADEEKLQKVLRTVPADGFQYNICRVRKNGLDACDFNVMLDNSHANHDHDMEYLFGDADHREDVSHTDGTDHIGHTDAQDGVAHEHTHKHRGMQEVRTIINGTDMSGPARTLALKIFSILGGAEAKAHGTTVEEVHFHEVGAVDSIVDIISAAVCFDDLGISDVIIPQLYEGTGRIRCAHGLLPIPVPAVLNIVQANGLKLHMTGRQAELVTPTGAAIAAAIKTEDCLPERFSVVKTGIGAGKREYEEPSLLRAMIIEEDGICEDRIVKLESNIDDCSGQALGHVMDVLMHAGARDVNYFPCYMKKNRPAYQLNVLCMKNDVKRLEDIIFCETTTIGIRHIEMDRTVLERSVHEIDTSLGKAMVKKCGKRIYPEYDSVTELCGKTGRSFIDVYNIILKEGV